MFLLAGLLGGGRQGRVFGALGVGHALQVVRLDRGAVVAGELPLQAAQLSAQSGGAGFRGAGIAGQAADNALGFLADLTVDAIDLLLDLDRFRMAGAIARVDVALFAEQFGPLLAQLHHGGRIEHG